MPDVSVVIASHRPRYLGDLLAALLAPSAAPPFETIAVCDYPIDELKTAFPAVIFHKVADRSISAKRNLGVRRSLAAVIPLIDDDCVPSADWVARGYSYLRAHPDAAAVEGLTAIEKADYSPPA